MSANLSQIIKNALTNQNVRNFCAWSDSTVVLHWLEDKGEYKVFVSNRVAKIREHSYLKRNYVPTRNNLADLGSRGCELRKLSEVWWDGLEWLGDCKNMPEQRNITNNEIERKKSKNYLLLLLTSKIQLIHF